ncbi:MAG: HD domain-containing phosphohydrolase [Pseudomonadota bacterium]
MTDRVLLVDDEPRLLASLKRGLHGVCSVVTAEGGDAALEVLASQEDIGVIVSDMRMPKMDGIELLTRVRREYPHVVRLMLTGNEDQHTAKRAVNEGAVYRFLNKPCERQDVEEALRGAFEQYRLQRVERQVLEDTLGASVKVMADILALARPSTFGTVGNTVALAMGVGEELGGVERWVLDAAANLSGLGYLTLEPSLLEKLERGKELEPSELASYDQHAEVAAQMLAPIPRMEPVAETLRHLERSVETDAEAIPLTARILRVVRDYERRVRQGAGMEAAIASLREAQGCYDPSVIDALERCAAKVRGQPVLRRVAPDRLVEGMVIAEDICTADGVLLVRKGRPVSATIANHLASVAGRGALAEAPLVEIR